MDTTTQQPKDGVPPTLDAFIHVLSVAKDTCGIPPVQITFRSASALLTMIRVRLPLPGVEMNF
jgi:hypothetical protein